MIYALALLIGVVSGLRTFTAPTAVAWAAHLGWLPLQGTPLAFLGGSVTPWILTVLALGEFIGDQLPQTPSRKVPMQFAARILSGALSGGAIGASAGVLAGGLVSGIVGAVIGTLGGAEGRARLARAFGRDMPAAFIEDAIAIVAAILIVRAVG
jgi:uncharacterized membrane protein